MAVSALRSFKRCFLGNMVEESTSVIRLLAVTSESAVFLLLRSVNIAKNYNKYKHKKLLVYKQTR